MTDMQYSPKLKRVMEEMKAILEKEDKTRKISTIMAISDVNKALNEISSQECAPRKEGVFLVPKHAYWDGDELVWGLQRLSFTKVTENFKRELKNTLDTMTADYLEIHTK